ncbi:MAG: CotH kinase family protein [Lachnospiraceae bacterium]|nr:CotH kinase family protein [Lachnospiraceae bacterium]
MINKSKAILLFISVIAMVATLYYGNVAINSNKEIIGVKVISQEAIDSLIAGKFVNQEVFHFPLLYDGNMLPYDWQTNTLYIPQNMNKIGFRGEIASDYGDLFFSDNLTFPFSGVLSNVSDMPSKNECIRDNGVFELYLINEECYVKYNVVFTGLPIISLTYDDYNDEELSWTGKMELIDPYHKDNSFVASDCSYRVRGNSTLAFDKRSYNLTLADKKQLCGLRDDEDWALVAGIGDNGYIHNKLSYDLWNKISKTNKTRVDDTVNSEFVEVFYDYNYVGLYNLTEKIDKKTCNLKNSDYLYRLEERMLDDESQIPVGDNVNPANYPIKCPNLTEQHVYSIKWPKDTTAEDHLIINNFEKAVYSIEGVDYNYATSLLNMDNIVDTRIYSNLICTIDNWQKNAFFIAPKADNYKLSEIMWDMNETFGDNDAYQFDESFITSTDMDIPYIKRLYEADSQDMSRITYKRWKKLRSSIIKKKKIKNMAKDMYDTLCNSGAMNRECAEWPELIRPEWTIDNVYNFIDGRIDFLDDYFREEYERYN